VLTEPPSHPVERGPGVWLKERRTRLALWIAAAEGVIVAISHDLTKWFVLALAALAGLIWTFGRHSGSNTLRQGLWIFAVSQLLALLLVLFAVFFKWLLILGLVAFAVIALVFLFLDRR
jgi:apolipoprotein N-acyltransferase